MSVFRLSAKWTTILGLLLLMAMIAAIGTLGLWGAGRLAGNVDEIGAVRFPSIKSLLVMSEAQTAIESAERSLLNKDLDSAARKQQRERIESAWKRISTNWSIYEPLPQSTEEAANWKCFVPAWNAWKADHEDYLQLVQAWEAARGDAAKEQAAYAAMTKQALDVSMSSFAKSEGLLNELVEINDELATTEIRNGQTLSSTVMSWTSWSLAGGIVLAIVVAFCIFRGIDGPVSKMLVVLEAAAGGDYSVRMKVDGNDEFGKLAKALNATIETATTMKDEVEEKVFFYESVLNAIPHPVSVTDNDMNWLFLNKAVLDLAQLKQEDVLGKHCSAWNADICNTEKCGICMAEKAGGKARSYFTQPQFPGKQFLVDAAFMHDRNGNKIGNIEVIQDITEAEQIKKYQDVEVDRLARNLDDLGNGNLDFETAVADSNEYTQGVHDNFAKINETLDKTVDAVQILVADADKLANAAVNGELSVRADADRHKGDYRKVVEGMNGTFDAVAGPLNAAAATLEAMSQKDFTKSITGEYAGDFEKLKDNVNTVVGNMKEALGQINESAAQFNEGSRVIAESSQSLASGAQTQSASVEEVSASIEELTASIDGVKSNANEADTVAKKTSDLAERGGNAVQKSVEAMELIRTSSDQIAEIIQVISEIASQTNLLALNAAIEAARAGEHGMGFAVVADEVRKLAERSNQAAGEITSLIKESSTRVQEGAQLSDETGSALTEIIGGVRETVSKISEIATATVEQANNAQQVTEAIQGIASITEQTAAGSEEMASSSEELGAQAGALKNLVSQFRTDSAGSARGYETVTE